MKKNNQKGFSVVVILLIIILLVLVGFVGWYVWDKQNSKSVSSSGNNQTQTEQNATSKATPQVNSPVAPFVNVIQDDESVIQVTPDKIAKTTDEANILTALHNSCKNSNSFVTVNHVVFNDNGNFKQDGNFAVINAGACTGAAKTVDDVGGSGSAIFLHKDKSGTWIIDTSSQQEPNCVDIDGLKYPTTIISSCYDGSTLRSPK